MPSGGVGHRGLELHDVLLVEQCQRVVVVQGRDVDLLDVDAGALQRFRRLTDGVGDLRVDGAEAGVGEPRHAELIRGGVRLAGVDGVRRDREAVRAVRATHDLVAEFEVADGASHRADMPVATGDPGPDAGHRDAAVGRLDRRDAGVRRRAADRDREVGAEADRLRPAAMAADSPPLDPPEVRSRFHGLFVRPESRLTLSVEYENSGRFVLARTMPPAAFIRATTTASASGVRPLKTGDPRWVRMPSVSIESFTVNGTPCRGRPPPRRRGRRRRPWPRRARSR